MTIRQIQSREFSSERRTILLLLGEKAGMREVVKPFAFRIPQGQRVAPARRTKLGDDGNLMQADGNSLPVFSLPRDNL